MRCWLRQSNFLRDFCDAKMRQFGSLEQQRYTNSSQKRQNTNWLMQQYKIRKIKRNDGNSIERISCKGSYRYWTLTKTVCMSLAVRSSGISSATLIPPVCRLPPWRYTMTGAGFMGSVDGVKMFKYKQSSLPEKKHNDVYVLMWSELLWPHYTQLTILYWYN